MSEGMIILPGGFPADTWPPSQSKKCLVLTGGPPNEDGTPATEERECLVDLDPRPVDMMWKVLCRPSPDDPNGVLSSAIEAGVYAHLPCSPSPDEPFAHYCRATTLCRHRLEPPTALPEPGVALGLIVGALLVLALAFWPRFFQRRKRPRGD